MRPTIAWSLPELHLVFRAAEHAAVETTPESELVTEFALQFLAITHISCHGLDGVQDIDTALDEVRYHRVEATAGVVKDLRVRLALDHIPQLFIFWPDQGIIKFR